MCGQRFLAGGSFLELGTRVGLGKAGRFVPFYITSVCSPTIWFIFCVLSFILKQESSVAQIGPRQVIVPPLTSQACTITLSQTQGFMCTRQTLCLVNHISGLIYFLFFEIESCVAQAGLELAM